MGGGLGHNVVEFVPDRDECETLIEELLDAVGPEEEDAEEGAQGVRGGLAASSRLHALTMNDTREPIPQLVDRERRVL